MVLVRNIKTKQTRYVGEVVAKDLKGLANMGFELVNHSDYPAQPKEEKKSVEDAVEVNEEVSFTESEAIELQDETDDGEEMVDITIHSIESKPNGKIEVDITAKPAKRKYTKRVNKPTK